MVKLDNVTENVLDVINDHKFEQKGAYNLRQNGTSSAMVTVSILKLREKQISRELIFTLMERPKEKLSIFRS